MACELKLANFFLGLSTRDQSLTWSTTSSEEEGEEREELSLCLSLGGIYSRPAQDKPSLLRSSSSSLAAGDRLRAGSISRSCSLPNAADNRRRRRRSPPSEVEAWAAASAAKSAALGRAIGRIKNQNNCLKTEGQSDSRASLVEPRGGTGRPAGPGLAGDGGHKRVRRGGGEVSKIWAEVTRKMPSVTTTGDGPHGKRIQGFLYKYTKSHVSIVCVCHGSFLTPAEFVCHAGGTQVENPMRHINVLTL